MKVIEKTDLRISEAFRNSLKEFDLETLENSRDVIYAIDENLNFIYFNPAWEKFAVENGGPENILQLLPLGSSVTAGTTEILSEYYSDYYQSALQELHPVVNEYECSSSEFYRIFRQFCYPMMDNKGLIIINRLVTEEPMENRSRLVAAPNEERFRDKHGLIEQCSFCRCVKPVEKGKSWEWVKEWVIKIPEKTSHSLCPPCFDYYMKNSA